jgi:SAM-dependent methyltransferase
MGFLTCGEIKMTDWTSGYVADIGYTYGYYFELSPQRVKLAFLNAGLVVPEFGAACELGFGQGLSTNLHAAASVCSWHGTDFNPAQAGFAQELASVTGADAHLYDESFDEFAKRDLPEFDYIGLHGIWSWVSDANRAVIVEFIRKKLKVGGILYISYNTFPGWGSFAPMRHLMTEHAEVIGADGMGILSRIDEALDFTEKLLATGPAFSRANPLITFKIKSMKQQNRHYLAHEYFNRDWHPMHFSELAKWLEPAKLTYACSANYLDHVDALNLTTEQQAFLKDIVDPMFKETVRDFIVNQQFRKDYWVKGARKLTTLEKLETLRGCRFIMSAYRPDVSMKVSGAQGEASLSESIYNPIMDFMSDFKVHSFSQIEQEFKYKNINFAQISQALLVLCGNNVISSVQDDFVITKAKKYTDKLNAYFLNKAQSTNEINFLASPVTGGGVPAGRFQQLFLLALQRGKKQPEEWVADVWQCLKVQGQKIVKEGKGLETPEENIDELKRLATSFLEKELPILRALQIA